MYPGKGVFTTDRLNFPKATHFLCSFPSIAEIQNLRSNATAEGSGIYPIVGKKFDPSKQVLASAHTKGMAAAQTGLYIADHCKKC